jgi:SAM-dependent methyltransferase
VGTPGEDNAARLEQLESWAAEQRELTRRQRQLTRGQAELLREQLPQRIANRILDRGLHTGGRSFEREQLAAGGSLYAPSAWNTLPRALRQTGVLPEDTFIDFGCGKGRIIHQAAKRPFRKVIGVEIVPALAEAARAAVDSRRHQYRCKDVEIVVADARDYRVPDDVTIVYFFHPFEGDVLEVVLQDIVASIDRNPRRVALIYQRPVRAEQVLATGRFRLVKELRGGLRPAAARLYRTLIFESF